MGVALSSRNPQAKLRDAYSMRSWVTESLIRYHDLLGFLFLMSLCGAFISLAMLTADKLGPMTPPKVQPTYARANAPK